MFIGHTREGGIIGLQIIIVHAFIVLKLWVLLLNPNWLAQTSSVQSFEEKKQF